MVTSERKRNFALHYKLGRDMRLSELKTGEKGVIVKVLGHGGFRKRIVEMGFIKGKTVEVLLNAPLRDPVKYKIMGAVKNNLDMIFLSTQLLMMDGNLDFIPEYIENLMRRVLIFDLGVDEHFESNNAILTDGHIDYKKIVKMIRTIKLYRQI